MARAAPIQTNFGAGEISPSTLGRIDAARYKEALAKCFNFVPTIQGGLNRRSGTMYVGNVKSSSLKTRLVPFEFSTTQAYVIEFGNQYVRFYANYGQIISGGLPIEVATPYLTADLFQLKFTQNADTLYIVHPKYAPRKLTRTSNTAWTLTTVSFQDGPYLKKNTSATALSFSGTSGTITVTASAALFVSTDVGRLLRVDAGTQWGWMIITVFTSSTSVSCAVQGTLVGSSLTGNPNWRLGVWSDTTGYPGAVSFHEDRLIFSGSTSYPERIDGSNTSDYENFAPTAPDGTVIDSHAYSFTLTANQVNVSRWLTSDENGMLSGTIGGDWVIRPSVTTEAITPTNVSAKKTDSYGSANVQPVQAGKATIHVQRSGRRLRELTYSFYANGYVSTDLSILSEHLTLAGITQMDYAELPQPIVWAVRSDGALLGMTYSREDQTIKVGWHWHLLGGVSDAAGSSPVVESICVIPSPDGSRDDVWMVVQRYIGGVVVRTVEWMTKFFEQTDLQENSFYVDCGLTYDSPITITGITKANPAVVTAAAHGLSNGNTVVIRNAVGMTQVNYRIYTVANVTANTFQLLENGSNLDSTSFKAYVSGGAVRKLVSTISGLDYLNGETVTVLGDGANLVSQTVAGGAITLSTPAATVQVGYGYNSDGQTLRLDAGAADGTAIGKTRRINRVAFMLNRSLGLQIGTDFNALDTLQFRTSAAPLGLAPGLFTGIESQPIQANSDFDNQICFRQAEPLPCQILAIAPMLETQDRG